MYLLKLSRIFALMKVLSIILTFYLFYLCSFPCQDKCNVSECKAKTEADSHKSHESKSDDCSTCSPFCVCNCCHGNTLIALSPVFTAFYNIPSTDITSYRVFQIKEILFSIWQPPKI